MRHLELPDTLVQVFLGDGSAAMMTRSQRRRWERRAAWRRFHASEDGKVSFVSIFTVLVFLVIILLVTNSGITVSHKIRLQNAADATAYSSAVWHARSLNAITTTNHLMGELTALTVILDSFGGTMLGANIPPYDSKESSKWNRRVRSHENAFVGGPNEGKPNGLAAKLLARPDKTMIDQVVRLLDDKGRHRAGAAIFDAKLTLKYSAYAALWVKDKANLVLVAAEALEQTAYFAWVGYALELVAVPIHVTLSGVLIKVGIEWAYLEAVETAVSVLNRGRYLPSAIQDALIPALSLYADGIVGTSAPTRDAAALNQAVRHTQQELATQHALTSARTFPTWDEMQLPVAAERPPATTQTPEADGSLGDWGFPKSEWTGKFPNPGLDQIRRFQQEIDEGVRRLLGPFEQFLGPLSGAAGAIADGLDTLGGVLDQSGVSQVLDAGGLGGGLFGGDDGLSEEVQEAMSVAETLESLLDDLSGGLLAGPDLDQNPCYQDDLPAEYRLPQFYWQAERRSQWVRATYPYVDEYRAPVIDFFREKCQLSDAATYYAHWANRYALANSFAVRRTDEDQDNQASLSLKLQEPQMYVLQGMQPEGKGRDEPWLTDDELAEEMFCLTAVVARPAPNILGTVIFQHPDAGERYGIASALVYNANGRNPEAATPGDRQPNTGWDTLNWQPPVRAAEWGNHQPSEHAKVSPWQLAAPRSVEPQNRVQLNWQVKLVPLTSERLRLVAEEEYSPALTTEHDEVIHH